MEQKRQILLISLKIFFLLAMNIIAFFRFNSIIKLALLFVLVVFRLLVYRNAKNKWTIFIFLLMSTILIITFWWFQETVLLSDNALEAVIRVWILLISGNLFLKLISQNDIILFLLMLKVPVNIIMSLILALNSLSLFLNSIKEIEMSYISRFGRKRIVIRYLNMFKILAINSLFLIVDCKKIYYLYKEKILNSIEEIEKC